MWPSLHPKQRKQLVSAFVILVAANLLKKLYEVTITHSLGNYILFVLIMWLWSARKKVLFLLENKI